jgi:eukaryotic-like serine/threonine-protein kinase
MTHPVPAPDRLFLDFQAAVAGRYSLERELGRGGMGVVYLAREVRLDRPVAIKLLPPSKATDPKLRERFLREARTAAKLSHPNVIPIHAVEEIGEFVFFAMAYVEGETLTERVRRRGPLPPSEAARVLRDVAWALAYAHGQGVIHRDVKPDNILLENTGRVLVADFGIASVVTGAGALSGTGEVIGTPEFMSPEQALGEAVDGRSDLYSLGIVGYFSLSGSLPFEAEKATEVLAKQVTELAPALARIAPIVPRRLAQAIDRCLSKDPTDRPDGTAALAEQLGQALEQRRDVPAPLRVFIKGSRSTGLGLALLYLYGVFVVSMGVTFAASPEAGFLVGMGALVGGPLWLLGWQARRITRLGYGQQDVDYAFQVELERSREERAFEYGTTASPGERITRAVALTGLFFGFMGMNLGTGIVAPLSAALFSIGGIAGIIAVVRAQRRADLGGRFWRRFWKGPIGGWILRQASRFGGKDAIAASGTHRPTELAIGMAAEQLYEGLPRETRRQLHDLPDVVHRLERDAQRMRGRLDELQDALANVERDATDPGVAQRHDRIVADLTAERAAVEQRLADAVAALETIRLNLLRLHAGTGTVRSLTTDLGLARDLARDISTQVDAYREIERAL